MTNRQKGKMPKEELEMNQRYEIVYENSSGDMQPWRDSSGVKEKLKTSRKEGGDNEEVDEVRSSNIDEEEVSGMRTDDKEKILRWVERDGFRGRIL